jgi:hypothetical protein
MWTIGTFNLEIVSRPPIPYVHFTRPNLYGKSGTPNLLQTVTDCFENLLAHPRQQCLHRGKILRQSETAKTELFFYSRARSQLYARSFGTKFDGHADTVEAIMWTIETFHFEIVSRPPTPYVHFTRPNFYSKSGTPNLWQTVTDRFENLREHPHQQCIHRGKILLQFETAKTKLFFYSGARSRLFAQNQAITLVRLARNLKGMQIQWRRSCGQSELPI